MSKIKIGFSLFLALFLVGILSTAVFANNTYGLTATPDGNGGFTVSFTGTNTGDQYTVQLYTSDGTAVGSPVTGALGTSQNWAHLYTGSVDIPSTGLTTGTVYTVKLYAGTQVSGTVLDTALATMLDTKYGPNNHSTAANPNGSGYVNSNQTGYNEIEKNRSTPSHQNMHGFYQNDTNSCASCHQTHTAANGDDLLFKDGTYSTCTACHDGTTGGYNAFTPTSSKTVNTIEGTFNVQQMDSNGINHNGSMHEADGSLQVSAAPGGNHTAPDVSGISSTAEQNATTALYNNTWGSEFDCASCHSAHGGGSNGENNLNTNPIGWGGVTYYTAGTRIDTKTKDANGNEVYRTATLDDQNGKLFINQPIQIGVPTSFVQPYVLVSTTAGTVFNTTSTLSSDPTKTSYLYTRAGVTDPTTPVIQTYRWDGNKYVADFSLWLRDVGHASSPFANANTVLYDSSNTKTQQDITTSGMTVVWKDGFAFGSGVANVNAYTLSVGIDVETPVDDPAALYDNTSKNYVVDAGTEMSKYCTACHTDYLSTTRTNNTGLYSIAHRHATAQDRLTCVRCHFAHGSDAQIIKDANDNSYYNLTTGTSPNGQTVNTLTSAQALQYLADPNPSSAIKRYTGMSVCYACHGKGEAFLGNPNNGADKTTGQYLFNGDPGIEGTTGIDGGSRTVLTTRH